MARDAAQKKCVVMILAAKEVLILREITRQTHFVTSGTKLGALVQRLEEGLLVEVGLRLHKLVIDELQHAIRAIREWVMNWLVDGVVGIAARAVNVIDRVAGGAGNASLGGRMFFQVEIRIIERTTEEGHHVVTSGAPA